MKSLLMQSHLKYNLLIYLSCVDKQFHIKSYILRIQETTTLNHKFIFVCNGDLSRIGMH